MGGFVSAVPAASVGYFAVRAAVALVLGAAVGLERQWRQRTAELQRHGRDDLALEAAVSRLSLEPAVSSVTWTTTEPQPALLAAVEE